MKITEFEQSDKNELDDTGINLNQWEITELCFPWYMENSNMLHDEKMLMIVKSKAYDWHFANISDN